MLKRAIAYSITGYCVLLVGLCFWLIRHQWPIPLLEEAIVEVEEVLDPPPPDFKAIRDTAARKEAFFNFMLPLVEQENQRLLDLREQLQAIANRAASHKLSHRERTQLAEWAQRYAVEEGPIEVMLDRLDRRINTIPTALALAQAASESAWGTSRFAREGNNYFGQWCFKEGCGLVPRNRRDGAFHEVTRFDSPRTSVAAYLHNINTHSAYHGLRLLRQQKTAAGEQISGYELAGKLTSYSERGAPYISELRSIIRVNALEDVPAELLAAEEAAAESLSTEKKEKLEGDELSHEGSDEHQSKAIFIETGDTQADLLRLRVRALDLRLQ